MLENMRGGDESFLMCSFCKEKLVLLIWESCRLQSLAWIHEDLVKEGRSWTCWCCRTRMMGKGREGEGYGGSCWVREVGARFPRIACFIVGKVAFFIWGLLAYLF